MKVEFGVKKKFLFVFVWDVLKIGWNECEEKEYLEWNVKYDKFWLRYIIGRIVFFFWLNFV